MSTKLVSKTNLEAAICMKSFEEFVRRFWAEVPSAQPLIWNWHMTVLCQEMQVPAERVFKGLDCEYDSLFNVPFGTSKSSICSILFQPWTWTRMPSARHMTGTHTEPLGTDLAGKSLAVINCEKYQRLFPWIVLVKKADSHFTNDKGGERRTCTVGGKTPTGFHAHFLGVDDPIDPKGAMSQAELDNSAHFVNHVLPSRKVTPKVKAWTYMVMQRLGRGDPSEVMIKAGEQEGALPVRQIILPGEISDDVRPARLKRLYENGLLDKNLLPKRVLDAYRARGAYFYAAQVMQNPLALGGGMFKLEYFNQRVKAAPLNAKRIRYFDRAATADAGCYTAGVLIARDNEGRFYVEHVIHGQWETHERNQKMRATCLRDRTKYGPQNTPVTYVEREGGSSGRDAWKEVARALAGFNVREDDVTGSKDVRAEPWSAQLAAGNVFLVEDGTWDIDGYIEEHCLFRPEPGKRLGKLKDRVDASSGAFNLLLGGLQAIGVMRVLTNKRKVPGQVRIVICDKEQLANTIIEERALLISIGNLSIGSEVMCNGESPTREVLRTGYVAVGGQQSPSVPPLPLHGLNKLMDSLQLQFCDMDPADHQETWQDLIAPYDKPASELIMLPENGKKLWSFLTKKRPENYEVLVFQDDGDKRAISVAYAVADTLRIPRSVIYLSSDPDNKNEGVAPNRHVFAVTKSSRSFVI